MTQTMTSVAAIRERSYALINSDRYHSCFSFTRPACFKAGSLTLKLASCPVVMYTAG